MYIISGNFYKSVLFTHSSHALKLNFRPKLQFFFLQMYSILIYSDKFTNLVGFLACEYLFCIIYNNLDVFVCSFVLRYFTIKCEFVKKISPFTPLSIVE